MAGIEESPGNVSKKFASSLSVSGGTCARLLLQQCQSAKLMVKPEEAGEPAEFVSVSGPCTEIIMFTSSLYLFTSIDVMDVSST